MFIKKILFDYKREIVIGIIILFVALLLRMSNLTLLPVFGDEAIYMRWAQIMGAEPGLRFVPLSDGKQPMFMWVLMFLIRRFQDPLFISRITSVFYGLGTLIGIFILSLILFKSKKVAFISSIFWAISPYAVFYDRLGLVDSMLTMFGVWTLLLAVKTVKTMRTDFAMLTGFALGGALLTKSPGLFFALMLPTTWIVSKWPERKINQKVGKRDFIHLTKLAILSGISMLIGAVMYNILRLGENFHLISSRNQDYVFPINQLWESPLNPAISNINRIYSWLWQLGPSLIIIFVLFTLIILIKRTSFRKGIKVPSEAALLFIWSVVPIVVASIYARAITARYVLFTIPTIFIFGSLIFSYIPKRKKLLRNVMIFGLTVFIVQALLIDYKLITKPENAPLPRILRSGYLEEWTSGTGIMEVSELIRDEYLSDSSKKIVVGTEGYFGTLPDALQVYLNDLPEITVIGVGLGINELPNSLVESKAAGNKTYLVINSTRLTGDPGGMGLDLLAAYPKALRKKGSREFNQYGPQEILYLFELKSEK